MRQCASQNTLAMLPMLLITAVSGEAATLRKLDWGTGTCPALPLDSAVAIMSLACNITLNGVPIADVLHASHSSGDCRKHPQTVESACDTAVCPGGIAALLASCLGGLGMSYFSFALRAVISATSFSVIGNVCKVLTILVNLLMWDNHASASLDSVWPYHCPVLPSRTEPCKREGT